MIKSVVQIWEVSGCCPAQPTPAFSSCPQLRLSPTLLSTYDPYDDMIFMFTTHAWDYCHPFTIMTLRPVFLASLWEVPFGRSPLGGERLSSIQSGLLLLALCLWPWRHSQKNKTSFEDIGVLSFARLAVTRTIVLCLWPTTLTLAYLALLMV